MEKQISPQNLLGIWEHVILKQVEFINTPTHAVLSAHAALKGISEENKTVTIVFKDKIFFDFFQQSEHNIKMTAKALYRILGKEYKIVLELEPTQEIIRFPSSIQKRLSEMAKHDDILRHKLKKLNVFGFRKE